MNPKISHHLLKWTDDEIRLIEAVQKNHSFCSPYYQGTNADLGQMWQRISAETKMTANKCRHKWSTIKTRYVHLLSKKKKAPAGIKYLDGKLSFLDQYYVLQSGISSSTAIHDVVVIESDEELGDTKDFMVLDLESIDKLLLKREPHEDIEMARMEQILCLVSKRIEETIALNPHLNQVNTLERVFEPGNSAPVTELDSSARETSNNPSIETDMPDVIELDDGSDCDSTSQSPHGEDMGVEMSSDNLRNAILAFPNPSQKQTANTSRIPIASMSIPVPQKSPQKADDMETVFDIHRRSDTKTFFQELGEYMNRFSNEKQDEIRLKICCVVTEVELEEID